MKYQSTSSCVIMSVILMTTVLYKALILQGGETWCWSLLGLKGLMKLCKKYRGILYNGIPWVFRLHVLTVLNSKQRIPPWDEVDFLSRLNHSFSNATIYGQFALHLSINTKKKTTITCRTHLWNEKTTFSPKNRIPYVSTPTPVYFGWVICGWTCFFLNLQITIFLLFFSQNLNLASI